MSDGNQEWKLNDLLCRFGLCVRELLISFNLSRSLSTWNCAKLCVLSRFISSAPHIAWVILRRNLIGDKGRKCGREKAARGKKHTQLVDICWRDYRDKHQANCQSNIDRKTSKRERREINWKFNTVFFSEANKPFRDGDRYWRRLSGERESAESARASQRQKCQLM